MMLTEDDPLPEGVELVSINGERKVIGSDRIDTDTRGGFTSYGIPETVPVGTSTATFTAAKPRVTSKE